MPITKVSHESVPEHHVDRIVLKDHFGKQHFITVHPFVVRDKKDSPGEYDVQVVDVEQAIAQETKLMELRERHHLEHMLKYHPQHPLTLSHPDHPARKNAEPDFDAFEKAVKKDCKDCG
jgi:hypothetical protein